MATKDWKKVRKNVWNHKKDDGNWIWISGVGLNYLEKFYVQVTNDYPLKPKIIKEFKTKSQALRFARDYMKKH